MQEYYYPDDLAADTLLFNAWNLRDVGILFGLFVISILLVVFVQVWQFFIIFMLYGFLSAKIANGYSIAKLGILYIRFLITDQLLFYWR